MCWGMHESVRVSAGTLEPAQVCASMRKYAWVRTSMRSPRLYALTEAILQDWFRCVICLVLGLRTQSKTQVYCHGTLQVRDLPLAEILCDLATCP